jgi:hypothetical protein
MTHPHLASELRPPRVRESLTSSELGILGFCDFATMESQVTHGREIEVVPEVRGQFP